MTNRPTMTKQHFIAIGQLIYQGCGEAWSKRDLAEAFATFLATQNPAFDRERFMLACLEGKISARKGTIPR